MVPRTGAAKYGSPEVTAEETSDHCLATHCATKVIFLAIQRSRKGWKNTQLVGLI